MYVKYKPVVNFFKSENKSLEADRLRREKKERTERTKALIQKQKERKNNQKIIEMREKQNTQDDDHTSISSITLSQIMKDVSAFVVDDETFDVEHVLNDVGSIDDLLPQKRLVVTSLPENQFREPPISGTSSQV